MKTLNLFGNSGFFIYLVLLITKILFVEILEITKIKKVIQEIHDNKNV